MSCSQGLQYTSSALSAYVLWCGSSCSQGCQEIFSALPLHCSSVSTELPSRLATFRLRLPASFFGCALSSSQGSQDIFSTLSACNALYVCAELLSRLSRHLLCSTSKAPLLSTELLSRLSRSLLCSACIARCAGTELLPRLPRDHPCSISNALLVSTELLSRFQDTVSIPSKGRHQQGSRPIVQTSSQGLCKASRLHSPWSILLLKGSARPQQGFTLLVQTFFSRALQGLYD